MVDEVPPFVNAVPEDSQPSSPEPVDDSPSDPEGHERKEYATLSNGILSPRHRKLAELFASGRSNAEIARDLSLSQTRVSVLKNNPFIAQEIERIRERIFESTVAERLKAMADPALNVLESALTDRTNRVKHSEKLEAAKWVIEKLDGKAAQKIDIGGSMLGSLLDKLDALKSSGRTVDDLVIDVTPRAALPEGSSQSPESPPTPISSEMKDWIDNF